MAIFMNGFALKLLAVSTMLMDHIGAALFPRCSWLRVIGRLAFPIYCFLIAEGVAHTKSPGRYAWRLFAFAFLSEIPFNLAFSNTWLDSGGLNVYFTLLLGMLAAWLLRRYGERLPLFCLLGAAALAVLASLLATDYGWLGVVMILLFYCCRERPALGMAAFALVAGGYSLLDGNYIELFCLAAIPVLLLYNGERGPDGGKLGKYGFYAFYPLHLLALYGIRCFW